MSDARDIFASCAPPVGDAPRGAWADAVRTNGKNKNNIFCLFLLVQNGASHFLLLKKSFKKEKELKRNINLNPKLPRATRARPITVDIRV